MKSLNRVLCGLVLVMAAASAVTAYLVYSSRGNTAEGWEKLTDAIRQTSAAMDRNSGTAFAKDLSGDALAASNAGYMDHALGNLKKQARDLAAERDALAEAVRRIGAVLDVRDLPELSALTNISTSTAAVNKVVNGVADVKKRQDAVIAKAAASAKFISARVTESQIRNNPDAAFAAIDRRIAEVRDRANFYNDNFRLIASATGAPAPDFRGSAYKSSVAAITRTVQNSKGNFDKAIREVEKARRQNDDVRNALSQRDGQIEALKNAAGRKDSDIALYRKSLGLDSEQTISLIQPGSPEARRLVLGKVIEVNRKFGFFAVNLGKNSVVSQQIGSKKTEVNPMIEPGMVMLVARDADSKDVKYIGKIKLVTVDNDCAIAECIELAEDAKIKVGDDVFFPGVKQEK